MKKSQFKKLTPLDQAAVRELIVNTPTAINTKLKEQLKGSTDLPLFGTGEKQTELF